MGETEMVDVYKRQDKLRAVFQAECDILVFVHNVARADLLAVEVDGDPFEVLVDDKVERPGLRCARRREYHTRCV